MVPALTDELGISELPDKTIIYDVAVVRAGPAGLAATVHAFSEGLSTVVIGTKPGSQRLTVSRQILAISQLAISRFMPPIYLVVFEAQGR